MRPNQPAWGTSSMATRGYSPIGLSPRDSCRVPICWPLAIGASGGYLQYSLDGSKLRAPEGTYAEPGGAFSHNDPVLPEGKIQTGAPVAEAGVYFQNQNLELGAAVQPVFAPGLVAVSAGVFKL